MGIIPIVLKQETRLPEVIHLVNMALNVQTKEDLLLKRSITLSITTKRIEQVGLMKKGGKLGKTPVEIRL